MKINFSGIKLKPIHILKIIFYFLTFVLSSVFNSFLLRVFTVGFSYNQIKPLLADIAVILIFGMFGYLFKSKKQFGYFMFWTVIFAVLSAGNSIYYTNYKSFMSVSLISTASQLGGVMDAVTENIMEAKDLIFVWSILALIGVYIYIKKKRPDYFSVIAEQKARKKYFFSTFAIAVLIAGVFATMLTGTDYSRLKKQWNREYVLGTFGLYTYQISDSVSCINAKLNMLMGYSESEEAFREFYDKKEETKPTKKDNDYSGIFEGKNILTIHAESIQQFTLDTYMNGEELTPNLNKLAREGLYFSNFMPRKALEQALTVNSLFQVL